jgi:hypothetical protein
MHGLELLVAEVRPHLFDVARVDTVTPLVHADAIKEVTTQLGWFRAVVVAMVLFHAAVQFLVADLGMHLVDYTDRPLQLRNTQRSTQRSSGHHELLVLLHLQEKHHAIVGQFAFTNVERGGLPRQRLICV